MVLLVLVITVFEEGRCSTLQSSYKAKFWERCRVCNMSRPVGSHHCRTCDICTYEFDHHCNILGTCIAARNRTAFVALIGSGGLMLACHAVVTSAACRADGIFVELSWRSLCCYAPAAFEGFYGGAFMLGLTSLQLALCAMGLTQHTASRATCRAALVRSLRRLWVPSGMRGRSTRELSI